MTAFPIPPYDYVSVGPYWTTGEYPRGRAHLHATLRAETVAMALGQWLGLGTDDCVRRTITDARGVLVLGWLIEPAWELPLVATAEIFELFRANGGEPLGLLDFELEMMSRQVE